MADWLAGNGLTQERSMKINITYEPKPIPTKRFDYCATLDGYEPGDPLAYGSTEQEATEKLLEYIELDRLESLR